MNISEKINEGFKAAEEVGEKVVQGFVKEYENNATPTDSFLAEVQHLNQASVGTPTAAKNHPLFPLGSLKKETDSLDSKEFLKKAAFQLGRERRRLENEEGASAALPLLMVETRIALAQGDTVT